MVRLLEGEMCVPGSAGCIGSFSTDPKLSTMQQMAERWIFSVNVD
jgi:hypothetical protein